MRRVPERVGCRLVDAFAVQRVASADAAAAADDRDQYFDSGGDGDGGGVGSSISRAAAAAAVTRLKTGQAARPGGPGPA